MGKLEIGMAQDILGNAWSLDNLSDDPVPDGSVPYFMRQDYTQVMGVLNVTPNSFSDGGKWLDVEAAVTHGLEMMDQGADIIDVGGESTAPKSLPIDESEECARVIPVIEKLANDGCLVSCDTLHAQTAQRAIDAGAVIINDVSGGLADPQMFQVMAKAQRCDRDVSYICQHWRRRPQVQDPQAHYRDLPAELSQEVFDRVRAAGEAGMDLARFILDPGLGFSKNPEHNWQALACMPEIFEPFPVLVGPSRKRFLDGYETLPRNPKETHAGRHPKDDATTAVAMYCAMSGIWGVRVHQVAPAAVAVKVARTLSRTLAEETLRRMIQGGQDDAD